MRDVIRTGLNRKVPFVGFLEVLVDLMLVWVLMKQDVAIDDGQIVEHTRREL